MTTPADFRKGDNVESPVGCRGIVMGVDRNSVTVGFVDYRKQRWETNYTAEWLKRWPTMLRKLPPIPTARR